ncbi:hypothetical protein A1O7_07299 [Cladophialophora yegresii CBS 114405]|uniref:Uncharacterized protein n=1 Tax=Cladophialophora yegresii CBS 114405 TaxID=1182544 RepID=W9VW94_9EURO|nr:uncharacterized protein A1O7_07299 [Cladophialophora yegresii CBS 114405]EXJ56955.1 hypothetical protein A1O7_07299 [Cladophialophora yegresii CBS 114405]
MGRKLANFGSAIETLEKELDETFDVFVEAIRPNPLAAKANATLLLRRSRDILDLQTQITDFRKGVVDLVRRDLARLNAAFPNVVPSYNLMFHLHFDILGYRAVSVRLADVLKLGSQLLNPQDPSFSVQRQGLKMIQFVHRESIACIEFCKDTLTDPLLMTNPSVEAEIRLQQLQFLLFARSTRVRLVHLGSPVEDTAPAMDVDAIKDSLDAATKLVRSSLRTCAPFGQTARDFANIFASADEVPSSSPIPAIKNAHVRETEKLWGQHRLGHLRTCAKNHVYSSKTFSDACPECGKGAQISSNEVFRKSSKHLFEIQFLEAMHAKSASARHVEPPKAEGAARDRSENDGPVLREEAEEALGQPTRELTQEERFLRAMRNGLPKIQGGRTGV